MMIAGTAVAMGLATLAVVNARRARDAEAANPPAGDFVEADGVRLHYVERGQGPAVVLIHGNGSMIADFLSSGLVDLLATRHRVIVFDRPGYGYSTRPHGQVWTAQAQARVIGHALDLLDIREAVVLGHSWGASVAVALGLRDPHRVKGLVLASGFYFPGRQKRLVAASLMMSGPALPLIGPLLRNTVAPVIGRLLWPKMIGRLFAPTAVPAKFAGFSREMALRPSQIEASAAESGLLGVVAARHRTDYRALAMPVAIVAGTEDRLVDSAAQSWRLHEHIRHSVIYPVHGAGHMVHQSAPDLVGDAVRAIVAQAWPDDGTISQSKAPQAVAAS